MYDMHAHILPQMDHGCIDVNMSVEQLAFLAAAGVTHVVATSHFYPDQENVYRYLERRTRSIESLQAWRRENPYVQIPRVYAGAEVLVTEGMHRMADIELLCIQGTNTLLLEMPFFHWSPLLYKTVHHLCCMDMRIVLAHVNRYPVREVEKLLDMGAYAQLNAEAFGGMRLLSRPLRRLLDKGLVVMLGSDLHGSGTKKLDRRLGRTKRLKSQYGKYIDDMCGDILRQAIPVFEN